MEAPPTEPQDGALQVHLNIGFGFCGTDQPEVTPDGTRVLRYRALPLALWHQDRGRTLALINEAAEKFGPKDEIRFMDLTWDPAPADRLTDKGMAFFEGLPIYGELQAQEPWLKWRQFDPSGKETYAAEANLYEPFMNDMVAAFPINAWAAQFFEPFKDMLPSSSDGQPAAVFMRQPTEAEKTLPVVRAHEVEKVEAPWGLWKVAVFACADEAVENSRKLPMHSGFQLVETAIAILPKEGWEFEWRPLWVWKFDLPAVLIPRMLYWIQKENVGHKALWAARGIHPTHRYSQPQATYQRDSEETGYRLTCHLWKPLASLTAEEKAGVEADMKRLLEQVSASIGSS
jgi:hypothetical protein